MALTTYDIIVIDECGDEQVYGSGFISKLKAEQALNEVFDNNPEFYRGWVEPNAKSMREQAWQDRFDNDTADLY